MRRPGRSRVAAAFLPVVLGLAACAPVVALQPAERAADPACAEVTVRLPDEIGGLEQRETNAQATGAWGEPVAVVLHCGVPAPPPTSELRCVTTPGGVVDWLIDDSNAPEFVFTSYGRDPAVTVVVDYEVVSGATVVSELDGAVARLPQVGSCIGPEEAQ